MYCCGVLRHEELRGAVKKIVNGTIGGTVGGFVGSVLFLILRGTLSQVTADAADELWSPCRRVSSPWCLHRPDDRAGPGDPQGGVDAGGAGLPRRPRVDPGEARDEHRTGGSGDIGLYGGQGVEKTHARIVQKGTDYLLADEETPGGTYLNDQRIAGLTLPTSMPATASVSATVCCGFRNGGSRPSRLHEPWHCLPALVRCR